MTLSQNVQPSGIFISGTQITVGSHKVKVVRYLSEGGFAHVYVVQILKPLEGPQWAVLKRIAIATKEALKNARTEVDSMKRLCGQRHIVTYIDSHASHLKDGGYEVFLLMEYCSGGGLIDLMNARLQNRLIEPEILKVFNDVVEGVACMHYLDPPLIHRDLKIENILIASADCYKICDFGSCAPIQNAAETASKCRQIEDDIQKNTTLQYRSPEMVDVYQKRPINEKSDIWALGVLLYKMCYYTTPFETRGNLAILNAKFTFPSTPQFSVRLTSLIKWMLMERLHDRPTIYQVLNEVCMMRGKRIYGSSEDPSAEQSPSPMLQVQSGAVTEKPLPSVSIPEVSPMRRGRIKANPVTASRNHSENPSETSFAFLDNQATTSFEEDLRARYPSIEEFSLNMDTAAPFDFDNVSSPRIPNDSRLRQQKVVELLADDAFAERPQAAKHKAKNDRPASGLKGRDPDAAREQEGRPIEQRRSMVSQGTMTSPPQSPKPSPRRSTQKPGLNFQPGKIYRSKSSRELQTQKRNQTYYMGMDLSGVGNAVNAIEGQQRRARGASIRFNSTGPSVDNHLHRDASKQRQQLKSFIDKGLDDMNNMPLESREPDANHIESNVEFLRRLDSSGHARNDRGNEAASGSSIVHMPRLTSSGSRHKIAQTNYVDAFSRFEQSSPEPTKSRQPTRSLSRNSRRNSILRSSSLPPDKLEVETEDIPNVLLQLEKRKYFQEARWREVEASPNDEPILNKATSIQERVSQLLANADTPPPRVAHGYGPFTRKEFGNQSWNDDQHSTPGIRGARDHAYPHIESLRPEPPPKPARLGGKRSKTLPQDKASGDFTERFPAPGIDN